MRGREYGTTLLDTLSRKHVAQVQFDSTAAILQDHSIPLSRLDRGTEFFDAATAQRRPRCQRSADLIVRELVALIRQAKPIPVQQSVIQPLRAIEQMVGEIQTAEPRIV